MADPETIYVLAAARCIRQRMRLKAIRLAPRGLTPKEFLGFFREMSSKI
jgi:hypothetical protein